MKAKRIAADVSTLLSPGLQDAPVMDLMCSQFVLTLAALQGAKFNVRRDINGLLALSGQNTQGPGAHPAGKTHPNLPGDLTEVKRQTGILHAVLSADEIFDLVRGRAPHQTQSP